MQHPERSAERDAALLALLDHAPFPGWSLAALRAAMAGAGLDPDDAELLFPRGAPALVEAFVDLADRWMEQDAEEAGIGGLRMTARVRAAVALRLARLRPYKEPVRRALALLALPGNAGLAAAATARTVDAIWHAAGDRSADFSWYTKRAILAAVYGATLLFWLADPGPPDPDLGEQPDEATLAFLDRRLANVGQLGKWRGMLAARARP